MVAAVVPTDQDHETPAPRLAAIFAHPDDESRIAGGTLALHARLGWRVGLFCATRGEAGDRSRKPGAVAETREAELAAACRTLGLTQFHLGCMPDGRVADVDSSLSIAEVVRFLRSFRPDVVITFGPDGRDGHPDHVAMSSIAATALSVSGDGTFLPELRKIGLEPWAPRRAYEVAMAESYRRDHGWRYPTVPDDELTRLDATSLTEVKRRAVETDHASQWKLEPWNIARSDWTAWSIEWFKPIRSPDYEFPKTNEHL